MIPALIVYGVITVTVAVVATIWFLIEAGEYGDEEEAHHAARIALTCYAWPLYLARIIARMANDARGGVK